MSLPLRLVFTIAALAGHAVAYSTAFTGCYASPPASADSSESVTSQNDCAAFCAGGYVYEPYAFFQASTGDCKCSPSTTTDWPALQAADGAGSTSAVPVCETGSYYGMAVLTSFAFEGCYDGYTQGDVVTQNAAGPLSSPGACFSACAGYLVAIMSLEAQGAYTCGCSNSALSAVAFMADTCTTNNDMFYMHSASASGLARRQNRDRLARRGAAPSLCPAGKTACATDDADGFECIDVLFELESCGGCPGVTVGQTNATQGVDCSALQGVALGAATCTLGTCDVVACVGGYDLVEGACVPTGLVVQT
ncbi:hypothetical protein Q5752_005509 [Cryptotrichosporon argae]